MIGRLTVLLLADFSITVRGAVTASTWHDRGLSVSLATLPDLTAQGFGSMPMRSLTADEIRWVQPWPLIARCLIGPVPRRA